MYMVLHVFLALLMQERSYKGSIDHRPSAGECEAVSCKMKVHVNTRSVCEIGLSTEDDGEISVLAILRMSL